MALRQYQNARCCFRGFSTSTKVSALILGVKGVIAYPGDQFEDVDVFISKYPLLERIPTNRLYGRVYNQSRPFSITDTIRLWVRTGAITVSNARACGVSLVNPFLPGNVGVLKDVGYMAFKSIELDPEESWKKDESLGFHQLRQFILDKIAEIHGVAALSMLPQQFERYLQDLNEQQVEEPHAIDNPALFPDLLYGDTCVELYRCALTERVPPPPPPSPGSPPSPPGPPSPQSPPGPPSPQSPPGPPSPQSPPGPPPPQSPPLTLNPKRFKYSHSQVLLDIGAAQMHALRDVLDNQLLPQFLPHHEKQTYDPQKFPFLGLVPSRRLDAAIVSIEVGRHATIHAEEDKVVALVLLYFQFTDYSRAEVIQVVQYVLPNVLRNAYDGLNKINEWARLRIQERFPRPDLYLAPSNGSFSVADVVS